MALAAVLVTATDARAQAPALPLPGQAVPPPAVQDPGGPAATSTLGFGDASRRGWVAPGDLAPPLGILWRTSLGQAPNFPVVAEGRVVVAGTATGGNGGTTVSALSLAAGQPLWEAKLAGSGFSTSLAAAPGVVVALSDEGKLTALDAATGAVRWAVDQPRATTIGAGAGDPSPLIAGDLVLRRGDDGLEAFDLATGARRWRVDAEQEGGQAAVGDRVYVGSRCGTKALDRRSGAELWSQGHTCSASGPSRIEVLGDRVAVRGAEGAAIVRSAQDGSPLNGVFGEVASDRVAVTRATSNVSSSGSGPITAFPVGGGASLWSAADDADQLLAVGGQLLSARGQSVRLRDLATGGVTWEGTLRSGEIPLDYNGAFHPRPAAGDGVVVVPAGHELIAFASRARTPAFAATLTPAKQVDHEAAASFTVAGTSPGDLRHTARVEVDPAPFSDDGWVAASEPLEPGSKSVGVLNASAAARDAVEADIKPYGNVRVRIRPEDGSAPSAPEVHYVFPRLRYGFRFRGGRIVTAMTARGSAVAGRQVAIYLIRAKARRGTRLAQGTLRRKGATSATATLRFRPVAKPLKGKDTVVACVVGAERHGMGRRDALQRVCGKGSFRF